MGGAARLSMPKRVRIVRWLNRLQEFRGRRPATSVRRVRLGLAGIVETR